MSKITAQEVRIKTLKLDYLIRSIDKALELELDTNYNLTSFKHLIGYNKISQVVYKILMKEYTDRGFHTVIAPEDNKVMIYLNWEVK